MIAACSPKTSWWIAKRVILQSFVWVRITGAANIKVSACPGAQETERSGLQVPVDCLESPPCQSTLGMEPLAAVWPSIGNVPNILSRQQLSSLTFIYSLTAGSSALSICSATQISPSKPHSSVSSLLSYIPAIAAPIQIPSLPSAEPPKPSTQPQFFIFSWGNSLLSSCAESPSVLQVKGTLLKANALCFQTPIMLCTCGSMNLGLGKRWVQTHRFTF